MTWLITLIVGLVEKVFAPLIENWIGKMEVQKTVDTNQAQINALIKSVAQLQTAKTPEEYEADIKAVNAADNANSK